MKKDLRFAAWPVAILCIVIGIGGIVSPDGGTALRRLYYATPGLFYALVAVRSAMAQHTHARITGAALIGAKMPRTTAGVMRVENTSR